MSLQLNRVGQTNYQQAVAASTSHVGLYNFNEQSLRILRCTAKAMAYSAGGLRFKAGTRPWLEGLSEGKALVAICSRRQFESAGLTAEE